MAFGCRPMFNVRKPFRTMWGWEVGDVQSRVLVAICISKNNNNEKIVTQEAIPERKWYLLPEDLVIISQSTTKTFLFYQLQCSCLPGPKQSVLIKKKKKKGKDQIKAKKMLCSMSHSSGDLGNTVPSTNQPPWASLPSIK